jgi:hypothetical protein
MNDVILRIEQLTLRARASETGAATAAIELAEGLARARKAKSAPFEWFTATTMALRLRAEFELSLEEHLFEAVRIVDEEVFTPVQRKTYRRILVAIARTVPTNPRLQAWADRADTSFTPSELAAFREDLTRRVS